MILEKILLHLLIILIPVHIYTLFLKIERLENLLIYLE